MAFPTWIVKAKGEVRRRLSRGSSGRKNEGDDGTTAGEQQQKGRLIKKGKKYPTGHRPQLSGAGDLDSPAVSPPTSPRSAGRVSHGLCPHTYTAVMSTYVYRHVNYTYVPFLFPF